MAASMDAANVENGKSDFLFQSAENRVYTSCYCEENVWHLCDSVRQHHPDRLHECHCVFISNKNKTIPLWQQKSSKQEDGLVVWDYHVIFLHKVEGATTKVYDLDSKLPFPCDFKKYAEHGITPCNHLKPEFYRYFRVLSAHEYLDTFASDRSHMLDKDGKWMKPPPAYPPICTQEWSNNIEDFISMETDTGVGKVLNFYNFVHMFYIPHSQHTR